MTCIDHSLLKRFVTLAVERLEGDWVVLGGTVLPLLGIEHRVTLDIDIAGPATAGNRDLLTLMAIADELGLPVETINQAATFFLHRVPDWPLLLVPVQTGATARVLRPNATLFTLLKLERLSDADLADCLQMLLFARRTGETIDLTRLKKKLDRQIAAAGGTGRLTRLSTLRDALRRKVPGP